MSETVRKHVLQIPLYSRASDITGLHECGTKYLLNHIKADVLPETGWFALGDAEHKAIEMAIKDDLDYDAAKKVGIRLLIERLLETEKDVMWSQSSRAKRTEDTVFEDFKVMLEHWFEDVHPDSPNRMPIYNEYHWPPTVEHVFIAPPAGAHEELFRSEVDAIFKPKGRGKRPYAIVDWKSGSTAKAKDMQIWAYHYGLRGAGDKAYYGKDDSVVGWFHHMHARKLQQVAPYPGDTFVQRQLQWVETQKKAGLWTAMPDWWCDYCRAKDFCPVFNTDAQSGIDSLLPQVEWIKQPQEAAIE